MLVSVYKVFITSSWCFRRKLEKKQEGEDVPKQVPHTLESLREKDETMLANVDDEEKLEVRMGYFLLTAKLQGRSNISASYDLLNND